MRAWRWPFLIVVLLALIGAGVGLGLSWPSRRVAAPTRLPGVVEVQEVRLGSKIGGRVESIDALEGEMLSPGQPVLRFAAPEMEAKRDQAQAKLAAAEAAALKARNGPRVQEKAAARAAVAAAKARWEKLQAGPRPQEIAKARHDLDTALADEELARADIERWRKLVSATAASRAEFDAAHAALDRSRGRVSSARDYLELLLAGTRQEEKDEAAAEVARLEANLSLLEEGTRTEEIAAAEADAAHARAELGEIEANLLETVVKAPSRALLEVLGVRVGDLVAPGTPVVRVLRAEDLWVRVYVPETELGKVHVGQKAIVTIDTFPNRTFDGVVIQINTISEFTPRNVQSLEGRRSQVFGVKVRVDDPQGAFKSGMAAQVTLAAETQP